MAQLPGEFWSDAGLELIVDSGPVAPLLQQVAADVKHFVKTCGLSRMPTRSEMHSEGESILIPNDVMDCRGTCKLAVSIANDLEAEVLGCHGATRHIGWALQDL